jgi:protoheme IX farnesyltransferase
MERHHTSDTTIALHHPAIVDYIALTKPELTLLSVVSAVGAAFMALHGSGYYLPIFHTFVGTLLAGAGAGVLNQYLERGHDAMMKRTADRPLPAGRLKPGDALAFGMFLSAGGVLYLTSTANILAGILAASTLVSYLLIYTPLKRRTPFATVIGGIPGALPPLIGWAAARGSLTTESFALFFILFFWQMPHFLALAWMYRKDYARAGYKMLPVLDESGIATSRQMLIYSIALIPASVLPTLVGLAGLVFFAGALIISAASLLVAVRFSLDRSNANARRLFSASLLYLPVLFFFLMIG